MLIYNCRLFKNDLFGEWGEMCMEEINNNKKPIYLFFDKTVRIAKGSETKTFPSGEYIATEDEYNKFNLEKYKKITLSFMRHIEISGTNGGKQIFEENREYSMPKYKFDELEFSRSQWGELTLDCVLKNICNLPFNAFNYFDDRLHCIFHKRKEELYKTAYEKKCQALELSPMKIPKN